MVQPLKNHVNDTYLPFLVTLSLDELGSTLFAERELKIERVWCKRELGYEWIQVDTVPSQRSDSRFLLP